MHPEDQEPRGQGASLAKEVVRRRMAYHQTEEWKELRAKRGPVARTKQTASSSRNLSDDEDRRDEEEPSENTNQMRGVPRPSSDEDTTGGVEVDVSTP